jgi:hypothetical protein
MVGTQLWPPSAAGIRNAELSLRVDPFSGSGQWRRSKFRIAVGETR